MLDLNEIAKNYDRDGYVSGVAVLTEAEAAAHRAILEKAERERGKLHYRAKMHTVMTSPFELATHPAILDVVEALIGPDILLYDVEYIVKEPETHTHVSWHQDLTYWGLTDNADRGQVSLWLALSPATAESGCMRMLPGSHKAGMQRHEITEDDSNVLFQGQTVRDVDEASARLCPLQPGEASFHHGWVLHASMPNISADRRIGLNAQYLAPDVRQTKHDRDSAILVRGRDAFGNFAVDQPAQRDFEPEALRRWDELNQLHVETKGQN